MSKQQGFNTEKGRACKQLKRTLAELAAHDTEREKETVRRQAEIDAANRQATIDAANRQITAIQQSGHAPDPEDRWRCNEVQFARLLCELEAAGAFTRSVVETLEESMDLNKRDIFEILTRADDVFEDIKKQMQ